MASTTFYNWTTPDDTNLVKDGASAIRTLGSAIDTTTKNLNPSTTLGDLEYRSSTANTNTRLGIGTSGQGLQVVAGVPAWAASSTSTLTTTGDLLYASAANTLARRAIGSTGDVLTVSGGLPTWAAPAAALPPQLLAQVSGEYIRYNQTTQPIDNTFVEDVSVYVPVYLPGYALDRIGFRTGSAHTGTTTVRLGIYNASSTTRLPTTVYLDAGTVSATAASTNYEITISTTPPAGFYWLVLNPQTMTGVASIYSYNANESFSALTMPQGTSINGRGNRTYQQTGVTGAFATAGTLTSYGTPPHLAVRIA